MRANTNITRIIEDEDGRLWLFYGGWCHFISQPFVIESIDIFDPKSEQAVPFDTLFSGIALSKPTRFIFRRYLTPKTGYDPYQNGFYLFSNYRFERSFSIQRLFPVHHYGEKGNIWLGWENNLAAIDPSGKILEQVKLPYQVVGIWAGGTRHLGSTQV
ncbi:MAG: hypothetical protein H6559_16705 [Lewinellaceae bacterium]|nr:hypothetical protein [Lewinellaceae bacterium]